MGYSLARNQQVLFTKNAVYRIPTHYSVQYLYTQNNNTKKYVDSKIVGTRGLHTTKNFGFFYELFTYFIYFVIPVVVGNYFLLTKYQRSYQCESIIPT